MRSLIAFAAASALLMAAQPERPGQWRVIGPGGGGSQYHPTVSPHDPRIVLAGCDMTGAYITYDAGESWRMFNLRLPPRSFIFDPVDRNGIYVLSNALYRSADAGKTWGLVYPSPGAVTGLIMPDDHASPRILTRPPHGAMDAVAVDPADSASLYAAIRQDGTTRLHVSSDRGASWKAGGELPPAVQRIYIDARSPRNGRTVFVLASGGVAVRQRGAWRRGAVPDGVKEFLDASLGFGENGRPVIYAISARDAYVSEDAGQSWRVSRLPGSSSRLQAIATSMKHPDVAYASYDRLEMGGERYLGVAKTSDRGRTWELVWKDAGRRAGANLQDAWLNERFGPYWGGNPYSLGVGPDDPNICYGTDSGRTIRTLDGGKTWKGVYSARQPDGGWSTTGLDVTTCYGVHFDPFDTERMLITYTDIGLFRSENGGKSWFSATMGVPDRWVNTTYWIEFDPKVKGRVWGVTSYVHDLPRPKMWRQQSPSRYVGGAAISDDGGRRWRESNDGMPDTAPTHILLDPESPVDNRVLYVAGFGRGVFKSVDGGRNWALKNNGIPGAEPFAWRLALDVRGTLYAVVARRSEDGSIGNDQDGALYRSTDGAERWTKVNLPDGVNGPNGLAIDPKDPRRMYLAAWGRRTEEGAVNGGIFLTTDAGATWRNVLAKDQHVYDVTIDPKNPSVLYACGFESSAWRSTDRGETWKRIPGYNFKWGHRVIPDPRRPGMVYIATYGGSVWHGPAEGDPKAAEDIVTPALSYGR
ncbi:MAG: hypothetical protein KIT09_16915 [Bryobacteraceae bacterium]|nr:hypothetical protein [Bryobacteraceae bacterium]